MIFNLSDLNSDWNTRELNQLGTFQRGKSRHRPRNDEKLFVNGKYPLIQTGEVKESRLFIEKHTQTYNDFGLEQSRLWKKNTLCITIAANIAETAILKYPMCFPDSIVGFNAHENESSELFMHYIFTYIKKSIQNSASGSIQDNINIDYLTKLKFKIPEKIYQDKIVDVLFSLDAKIELNNKINKELEDMAKTLYEYWFVQFDFPDENSQPYKSSGGKMEYNKKLKREIPKGWGLENIANSKLTSIINPGIESYDGKKIYLSTSEVENNDITNHSILEEYDNRPSRANMQPEDNSIWFARMKDTKKVILLGDYSNDITENYIFSTGFAGLRINPNALFYMWNYIHNDWFEEVKNINATGSTQKAIINDAIANIPLVIPSDTILKMYYEKVYSIYKKIYINQIENLELVKLRDWLLPMLMNGQVSVK